MKKIVLTILVFASGAAFAGKLQLPGGGLTVPGYSPAGVSFVYSGDLTSADTFKVQVSGTPCYQVSFLFGSDCTNGAGIVANPGSQNIGDTSTFTVLMLGTNGTWNMGALLMNITSVGTFQLFAADDSNGLGTDTPPTVLIFDGPLGQFTPNLSWGVTNPTITFLFADENYENNNGSFVLAQAEPTATPEPSTVGTALAGLTGLAVANRIRRRRAVQR